MRTTALILSLLLATTIAAAAEPELQPALSLFKPAKDDDAIRENAAVGEVVPVPVKRGELKGEFASPDASADYEMVLTHPQPGQVGVEYRFTWKGKPDALIAAHGIRIPFAFGPDPKRTKVVVGAPGRSRGEIWWVDQNDQWHIYWMLSDQHERWPLWRLGGIAQESPDRFVIWKANRSDTPAMVLDQGQSAPGWLDVSDTDHGLTVIWDEMSKRSPCSLVVNHPAKAVEIWFHPPTSAPVTAESLGCAPGKTVSWKFTLAVHADVFPALRKQELTRPAYAQLLKLIDEQKLWQYVAMNYLVPISGDLDTRIRLAIDTGIQPSEILDAFDSGNTWRMQVLCKAVGAPYSKDHDANIKAVLDYCRGKAK
jgi:hypothetical protein